MSYCHSFDIKSRYTYFQIDKCFEAGTYVGNDIDYVKDLPDAESCQKECQKIPECKFWTYNPNTWNGKNKCFRQTANANETLGTCKKGTCIRGPRDCPGKYISYQRLLQLSMQNSSK